MTRAQKLAENVEELALLLGELDCYTCPIRATEYCTENSDNCAEDLTEWLKEEVKSDLHT